MKYFLLSLLVPFLAVAQTQTDTIFKKDSATIVCKITEIDAEYITFDVGKLKGRFIHKENVVAISYSGKRETIKYQKGENNLKYYNKTQSLNDTVSISQELDFMKMCLRECHKEYTIGLITMGGGLVLNGMGIALNDEPDVASAFYVLGGTAFIVGCVLMIDSHKWIKRAGVGVYGRPDRVGVYYRFK